MSSPLAGRTAHVQAALISVLDALDQAPELELNALASHARWLRPNLRGSATVLAEVLDRVAGLASAALQERGEPAGPPLEGRPLPEQPAARAPSVQTHLMKLLGDVEALSGWDLNLMSSIPRRLRRAGTEQLLLVQVLERVGALAFAVLLDRTAAPAHSAAARG